MAAEASSSSLPSIHLKGIIFMKFNALILATMLCASPVWAQHSQSQNPAPHAKKPVKKDAPANEKGEKNEKAAANQHEAAAVTLRTPAYNEYLQAQQYESDGNFVQAVESYKKV